MRWSLLACKDSHRMGTDAGTTPATLGFVAMTARRAVALRVTLGVGVVAAGHGSGLTTWMFSRPKRGM